MTRDYASRRVDEQWEDARGDGRLKTAASGRTARRCVVGVGNIGVDEWRGVLLLVTDKSARGVNAAPSCTVEMSDLSKVMDCAVIDEIQLLSDPHRGYAYTRALLGRSGRWSCTCAEIRGRCRSRRVEVDGGFVGGEGVRAAVTARGVE